MKSFGGILTPSILFCQIFLIKEDYDTTQNVFLANDTLSDSLLNYIDANAVLIVMILVLQLIIMPCFPWLVPRILKRMWFGLFLTVLCFVIATIFLLLVSTADFNYTWFLYFI